MRTPPTLLRLCRSGQEFATEERCFITEIINDPACPAHSLALGRVEPGVTTQLHRLSVAETYSVMEGEGRIEIDGQRLALKCGEGVHIAPGQAQRITNTGVGDLRLYLICQPRFTPASYHNLEDNDER